MKPRIKISSTVAPLVAVFLLLIGLASPMFLLAGNKPSPCVIPPPPVPTGGACLSATPGIPGCLDSAFGGGTGMAMVPTGMSINGMVIQNVSGEARIVAVGSYVNQCLGSGEDWIVVRYHSDGTLDTSFGVGGIIKGGYGGGSATAKAVVLQPDNKLLVGGSTPSGKSTYFPAVARYNVDGTLDTTFGVGGVVNVPYEKHGGWVDGLALQSDGRIVASGCSAYPCRLTVFRLSAKGVLDTTFNGTGQYVYTAYESEGRAIALQPVGSGVRIVVAGHLYHGYTSALLFGFTQNGTPDPTFGSSGIVMTDFSGYSDYMGLTVDSSNDLVAVGEAGMARYDQSGNLDPSFGNNGIVSLLPSGTTFGGAAVANQSDGSILVVGSAQGMTIWRFTPQGALDTTFAGSGYVNECFSDFCNSYGNALVLRPDGSFVAAGTAFTTDGVKNYGYAALASMWR